MHNHFNQQLEVNISCNYSMKIIFQLLGSHSSWALTNFVHLISNTWLLNTLHDCGNRKGVLIFFHLFYECWFSFLGEMTTVKSVVLFFVVNHSYYCSLYIYMLVGTNNCYLHPDKWKYKLKCSFFFPYVWIYWIYK